jgi:glycine cleavage system aminomethyltransferase T
MMTQSRKTFQTIIHYWRFKGLKPLKRCKLSSVDLAAIKYYHFEADFAGLDNVIISATGYTGSGGFEIYCKMQT